jgi:hypothetical protein
MLTYRMHSVPNEKVDTVTPSTKHVKHVKLEISVARKGQIQDQSVARDASSRVFHVFLLPHCRKGGGIELM